MTTLRNNRTHNDVIVPLIIGPDRSGFDGLVLIVTKVTNQRYSQRFVQELDGINFNFQP